VRPITSTQRTPEYFIIDGNGIAHPRKMGLVSFVGVILDICTIGCAKTPFFPFVLPSEQKGSYTFFRDGRKDKAGICLRTRTGVKPIFVSPGHRIDFISAMKLVLSCSIKYFRRSEFLYFEKAGKGAEASGEANECPCCDEHDYLGKGKITEIDEFAEDSQRGT